MLVHPKRGALHGVLVVLTVALGAMAIVAGVEQSFAPPGPSAGQPPQRPALRTGPLVLAGSGSNLPLTQRLVQGWRLSGGGEARVLSSIGSSGGLQALSDGVIDIALVSRPLRGEERAAVVEVPYARAGIVVATRLDIERIDLAYLRAIYAGERLQTESGERIVPILREEGDSTFAALSLQDPDFSAAIRRAQRTERFRSVFTDQSMEHVLSTVRGALGLLDRGFLEAQSTEVRGVPLGPEPTPEVLERGEYPYTKDLLFALPSRERPEARAFIDFVQGPAGRAIIRGAGYMALNGAED